MSNRVLRGGSWSADVQQVRTSGQLRFGPALRTSALGFRLAADVKVPSFAFRACLKLLIESDELQSAGRDDAPRLDEVFDEMDGPWSQMTPAEVDLARKVSSALGEAWVEDE